MIGLPQEIFTPLFAMARIVGWCAHRNEELNFEGKRIIRPAYKNVLPPAQYRVQLRRLSIDHVQLRTSEHRSMYSYVV